MKIRMLFGTVIEQDGKNVNLENDSTQDLVADTAQGLIDAGRAEPLTPAKKGKD